MLAIAIGGGLGYVVPLKPDTIVATQPVPQHAVVEPIAPPPPPPAIVAPPRVTEPPAPEIEIKPEPVKPGAAHVAPKPPRKPKPSKSTPCNVYEHMDGC
jgi:hypothetical protein